MKIECVKDKLIEALNKVERITGKHLSLPILSCIYLKASNNELILRATNLDCGIEVYIPAKISGEGEIAFQGSILTSLLSGTQKDKNITIEAKDGSIIVSSSFNTSTIKTQSPEDFPTIPKLDTDKVIEIDPQLLVKGFKSVWYSASTSTVKPELASVYVYKEGNELIFVSTDSFRLAEKKVKVKDSVQFTPVIIPAKNISDITRILEGTKGDIKFFFDKNQIGIKGKDFYLMSRVIDATFPDYKQIIPKVFVSEALALKQDVSDALKTAHVFADKFNQLSVSIHPSKKFFEIATKNNDIGDFKSVLDATVSGQDLDINFNHRYVSDCLQAIEPDSISFSLAGQNKPMVIHGVSDKSFTYLVMPMNR
ncbi:MAG: DNA polymerase III subunit beta [Candidatus Taylorbacteria bacterium CG10_big_fil_rev_8_21_14_0_10_41_48]|uniref:Beta sliding clamp n=1 Tax=Candidatus Taylorbacteria bacterium CG10_big_fil_rev_8_21_14_0_10_41_48 TaxID=1975024 RepID=A0A2M8LD47_9BACT|nr:MAG: DNA polymerase III subunit beta [Candidatus Taylorbacteria bacterium CG10_big_fil_rev_8_21_14_0_10_41_48]